MPRLPEGYDEVCFEEDTGMAGRLTASNGKIRAIMFSFRGEGSSLQKDRMSVTLSSGGIATLMDLIIMLFGTFRTRTRTIDHVEFEAAFLVVGTREWRAEDRVTAIEFCLPDAKASLFYHEHMRHAPVEIEGVRQNISGPNFERMEIARVQTADCVVVLSKMPSMAASSRDNIHDPTWITVNFDNPVELRNALQIPFHIKTFFEISEGVPLQEKGMKLRAANVMESVELHHGRDDFELYGRSSNSYLEHPRSSHAPIFRIITSDERQKTTLALKKWLDRRKEWGLTYWLISEFVHRNAVYDRSNILRAMAWFESIPDYQSDALISKNRLQKFRQECRKLQSFTALGICPNRLGQVLNELTRLPLEDRIKLAINSIRSTYGQDIVSARFESDCELAKKIRNSAAHGGDDGNEKDPRQVIKATAAIQTLAMLSTIMSLDVEIANVHRVLEPFQPHSFANYSLFDLVD